MEYQPKHKDLMAKYEELVGKCYQEPIDGKFEDITPTILEALGSSSDEEGISSSS